MKNKIIITFCLLLMSVGLHAQTGGPGQPEFMQFQQAGTSDLVNPSSGSFSYQIPLFTIGGYPMNLTYQSGIQMEDVSSMVGMGWNLNAGSVVRTLRGIPDDFNKDIIKKKYNIKSNETYGGKLGVDLEIAGLPIGLTVGADLGVFYNNYKGWGLAPSLNGSISANYQSKSDIGGSASLGLGIGVNSQEGVDKYFSYSVGLKLGKEKEDGLSLSLGKTMSLNSSEGLKSSLNMGLSYVRYDGGTRKGVDQNGNKENKSDQSSSSLLGYSNHSYLNNSFKPDIDYPFENISGTFSATLGFDGYFIDPNFRFTGYFSKQRLSTTSQDFFAVGSMYETESNAPNDLAPNTLMDFDREKKLPYFIGESKILPIPIRKPDIFNLNAQGLSMTFSVKKNDMGIVGDAYATINSFGVQGGAEVNLGNLLKVGANIGTTTSYQTSKRWSPISYMKFKDLQESNVNGNNGLYQQQYFKNHGEINKFDNTMFDPLGGYNPFRFDVSDEKTVSPKLLNNFTTTKLYNKNQPVRQSTINYLTAIEASTMGFDKFINFYTFDNDYHSEPRTSAIRKDSHLSEISVTQPDGMKYVFGMPVYNITQEEVSFSVAPVSNEILALNIAKNLVHYVKDVDNTVGNQKGIDNFFESTTTPAYVTQFLITAVLSPDYRDITNNGITDDDIGNYVKFSYYKENFSTNPLEQIDYNWRTPFDQDYATFNAGSKSDKSDDKGTYLFGTKELEYIHSIESKTEIAEYYYSKRTDGLGVKDENGGKNTAMVLRKLDSIRVFSKNDLKTNGSYAVPIKSVLFTYNNTLCKNIDNTSIPGAGLNSGKLTLNTVSFTYENSQKGKLTPYEFDYGNSPSGVVNPNYDIRDVNKWGNFQENPKDPVTGLNAFSDCDDSPLSNIDYPYSSQDKNEMDKNAYAWNLTDITIPGKGKIKVTYEANDYGYIQNKTAGQMFKVTGFADYNSGKTLYKYDNINDFYQNFDKIYFRLYENVSSIEEFKKKYIQDIENSYMYYKFLVNLRTTGSTDNYEYISGYARLSSAPDSYGLTLDNDGHQYAWITLLEADELDDGKPNNGQCNPILKNALQYMRINRSKLIYNNSPNAPTDIGSFADQLPDIIHQMGARIEASTIGVNRYCRKQEYCKEVKLENSFIRLYNPLKKKISGGCRVKEISIDDNFSSMTDNSHESKSYTTSYDYTTEEIDPAGVKRIISSGVADYEPLVGGDEISLKQPLFSYDRHYKAPDNEYYVETPVDESLFPAPRITYGKVTQITNKTNELVGKTGKIVNEFFTAKDDPVKVGMTTIAEWRDKSDYNALQPPFLAIDQQHDFATVSQGYSIELNNMSGLPKANWVYDEKGNRLSGEVMEYFPNNNNFTTVDHLGNINYDIKLGLSVDYTIDGRQSKDNSVTDILAANLNISIVPPAALSMFMPLFSEMTEEKQFQSIVVNKIIDRNVILKSKTVFDQTSFVTTENLAFDEVTGEALLTKTTNEFNDTLFSFKYPAYWMYEGMGPSFENTKLHINSTTSAFNQFLKIGDEIRGSNGKRLWVNNPGSFLNDDNSNGLLAAGVDYQVYNSGAKNLLTQSAGQVVTWNYNPLSTGKRINFDPQNILNSSAIEYYDDAILYCDPCLSTSRSGKNAFLLGKKGNWKPLKSWYYLAGRTPGNINNGVTNIKEQGLFENYNDFWTLPNPKWVPDYTDWDWKEKVNKTDVDGRTIETVDRIGRKVSSLFGYKNTLMTAQISNSAYNEAYFDGFEDYFLSYCDSIGSTNNGLNSFKRMKILNGTPVISKNESHTGKYSLEVAESITFSSVVDSGCGGGFLPENGKEYIFSCWVKVNNPEPILSDNDASVLITCNNNTVATLVSEGPVIEGFQRIFGKFSTLPAGNLIKFTLNRGHSLTYFDDIRIFPADGNMVSYVYDDVNLRLTNILDENNYFTKSEYNNQGELIRIKKETEKGVVTMKESQNILAKKKQ